MLIKRWPVLAAVLLLLAVLEYSRELRQFLPGYEWFREAYPYYIGQSYLSLAEVALVLVLASVVVRKTGLRVMNAIGIDRAPWFGLKVAALMVAPLYLVFALVFNVADMVPLEVLYLAAISPFAEEIAYRGFAFGLLRKVARWRFWPAALVPAAFFAWGHVDQANDLTGVIMTVAITGGGALVFSWLFEKWGSLWVPLGLHIAMNLAWNLFAVGDGAFAGTLPTIMQLTTVIVAVVLTLFRDRIPFLRIAQERR